MGRCNGDRSGSMCFGTLTALQPISDFLALFTKDLLLKGFQNSIQRGSSLTWKCHECSLEVILKSRSGESGVWESSVGKEIAEGQQIWGLDKRDEGRKDIL